MDEDEQTARSMGLVGAALDAPEIAKPVTDGYRKRLSVEQRAAAHKELDRWFDELDREQPDLGMGEQASIRFSGGYGEGYMTLTCKRSLEREFGPEDEP